MALTAEKLLPLLKYPVKSRKELAEVDMKVDANVSAGAHFLAAVYNGNWGQSIDVVRHHLRKALEFDRGIGKMMQFFLDFNIRHVPSSVCRSFEQLWESPHVSATIVLYNDSPGGKFLNPNLATAMIDLLEEFGIPTRSDIEALLIQEHGVDNRTVNLVDKLYSTGSYAKFVVDRRPEFYKATAKNTTFPLVCDKPQPLNFSVTTKVPNVSANQTIALRLNGNLVTEIAATDRWSTTVCSAPAELVHHGFNQVEIEWPMPLWSEEEQREHTVDCLEAGQPVEITPIFGLIHSLRVSTERSASPWSTHLH